MKIEKLHTLIGLGILVIIIVIGFSSVDLVKEERQYPITICQGEYCIRVLGYSLEDGCIYGSELQSVKKERFKMCGEFIIKGAN